MAVVSKEEIRVFGDSFMRIVKYSAKTETFTIDLPKKVCLTNKTYVSGGSLAEAKNRFGAYVENFKANKTKTKKVILVSFQTRITGKSPFEKNKYYETEEVGWSDDGIGLTFAFGVFNKLTTKIPNQEPDIDYESDEEAESRIPVGLQGLECKGSYALKNCVELPWTQEYETILIELGEALSTLIFKLLSIAKSKRSIDKFMVSGQKLLPPAGL